MIEIQGERGIFAHHFDGDFLNGSWAWSSVAGVARPRARCSFEATREESNGGCGEAVSKAVCEALRKFNPMKVKHLHRAIIERDTWR